MKFRVGASKNGLPGRLADRCNVLMITNLLERLLSLLIIAPTTKTLRPYRSSSRNLYANLKSAFLRFILSGQTYVSVNVQ